MTSRPRCSGHQPPHSSPCTPPPPPPPPDPKFPRVRENQQPCHFFFVFFAEETPTRPPRRVVQFSRGSRTPLGLGEPKKERNFPLPVKKQTPTPSLPCIHYLRRLPASLWLSYAPTTRAATRPPLVVRLSVPSA
ncbi:hypothetical protein CGRA01v4_01691 [Colletotrichum graminicola]|nr:hypothetical protein CGRA01v4_01691 [Colletotrichum graminicola]